MFQKLSARNKANRAKVKFIHTGGQKSLARLLEEEVINSININIILLSGNK